MIIWKYTDQSRSVVVSDDGCRSCLVTALPEGTVILPPDPPIVTLDDYKAAIEVMLQQYAKSLDYITWDRLLAHANSPVEEWKADSVRAWKWKSTIDKKAYEILESVQRGKIEVPTIKEFLSLLPIPDML